MQVIGSAARIDVAWPEEVMMVLNFARNFMLGLEIVAPECMMKFPFKVSYITGVLTPWIISIALVLNAIVAEFLHRANTLSRKGTFLLWLPTSLRNSVALAQKNELWWNTLGKIIHLQEIL